MLRPEITVSVGPTRLLESRLSVHRRGADILHVSNGRMCEALSPIHPAYCLTTLPQQCKRSESEFAEVMCGIYWPREKRRKSEEEYFAVVFKRGETETNTAACKQLLLSWGKKRPVIDITWSQDWAADVFWFWHCMLSSARWFDSNVMIGRTEKNLQSSVIVPRNEIDSHPTEHEITLADDTAVTVPETQHDSNRNNQHLLAEQRHTHAHPYLEAISWCKLFYQVGLLWYGLIPKWSLKKNV